MSDTENPTDGPEAPPASLIDRVTSLEQRMAVVESERPGRKAKPLLRTEVGVCGLDPDRDSSTCDEATVYRYQQGCKGTACVMANREYYARYREEQREQRAAASAASE